MVIFKKRKARKDFMRHHKMEEGLNKMSKKAVSDVESKS
jgi:hypothetical protein